MQAAHPHDTLPRPELERLQLERLRSTIRRVTESVPFYREKLRAAGITDDDIRSVADLRRLPFTTKQDLRDHYPFGLFAVPLADVARIHASSGTTGKMTVVGYTLRDIETWAELIARSLACAGVRRGDIVHNAYGYGLFTGGLGVHYGAEKLGVTVIPISGGNTKRQIMILQDFGPTVLTCTPSYALNMAETMRELGVDPASLKLRVGIFGAEPWSEAMRGEIEKQLNLVALDIYGLSEVMGPGVAMECLAKNGPHIFEDHFMAEVVDPDSGEPLAPGERGELVFTSLTKEAFPILRYRTRDITSLDTAPCACGRTLARMVRVTGRTDDMLIIRGVNVFPSQIESLLVGLPGVEPHYQLIVDRVGQMDTLEVQVEMTEGMFSDEVKKLETLARRIENDIKDYFGVTAKVKLVEPKSIQRSEGKAQRVIDKRKLKG
ncbi:MAG: phenylacetate--CoA ligase family protein [Candidatus Methylomirabilia bacterium]